MKKLIFSLVLILFSINVFAWKATYSTQINVDCTQRKLYLIENGSLIKEYKIALGRGGLEKKMIGDFKTPLGIYPLGSPRLSYNFGTFIPIGYPTTSQKSHGYSGCDVGIHGPHHSFKWLGSLNCLINWTAGCIAVAKNSEIEEIAAWVVAHQPINVEIN